MRQVVSAAGDGATAAVAAERYIEELDAFQTYIANSDKKVLLVFFNASNPESLEFISLMEELQQEYQEEYKIAKVDLATKKNLAEKYRIKAVPAVVVLDKGKKIRKLEYCLDKAALKAQIQLN